MVAVKTKPKSKRPRHPKTSRKWICCAADERAVRDGYYFDEAEAERVCEFFPRYLRHSLGNKWAGKPFELIDWQRYDVLYPVFGWRGAGGMRRFKDAYVEIAKKNGKSTLGAGVGLYGLVGDGEKGAHVYSTATKKEQAALIHDEAVRMVQSSPELKAILKVHKTTKTISDEATFSKYSALSADGPGSEGENVSMLLCDELHVWRAQDFWDSLRYSSAARENYLRFITTTA